MRLNTDSKREAQGGQGLGSHRGEFAPYSEDTSKSWKVRGREGG